MRHESRLVCQSDLGSGAKNLTARKSPDMLGGKMGTKRVPVRALKVPYSSKCTVFRGEAIRDDGKSPNPLFWVETADFRADIFGRFSVIFSFFFFVAVWGHVLGWTEMGRNLFFLNRPIIGPTKFHEPHPTADGPRPGHQAPSGHQKWSTWGARVIWHPEDTTSGPSWGGLSSTLETPEGIAHMGWSGHLAP